MSITIARTLKKGDTLFECDYGQDIQFTVTSEVAIVEEDDDIKYSWEGTTPEGRVINYMISRNYAHYGPKLYLEPQFRL